MNPIVFILLAAALIAIAFYVVAFPMLQAARRTATPAVETVSSQERLDELLAQRDAAFQAIRELNFDHQVGKITDEDYAAFEVGLKQHAADTLRALDEWEAEADDELDLEMEADIQARRRAYAAQSSEQRTTGTAPCPTCGQPATAADRFCSGCGADLTAARPAVALPASDSTCPKCGKSYVPGDRFCGSCGQPLAEPARSVA